MSVSFSSQGDWSKTTRWMQRNRQAALRRAIERYANAGLVALKNATPIDSGETVEAWGYEIIQDRKHTKIVYTNSHSPEGFPVAIMLQYGHGTGSGGWVEGRDFINPAIRAIFDKIAEDAWRELIR